MSKESCERKLVRWGLKTRMGTLVTPNFSSARYGQRMSTAGRNNKWLPISPLVAIDIVARDLGILQDLQAYYIEGWKRRVDDDGREYFSWKPSKRKRDKAHMARRVLADAMEIREVDEDEVDR